MFDMFGAARNRHKQAGATGRQMRSYARSYARAGGTYVKTSQYM